MDDPTRAAPAAAGPHRPLRDALAPAAHDGDLARFERYLADDVVARPDGGGKVHASRVELVGLARVSLFLDNVWRKYWADAGVRVVGASGRRARLGEQVPEARVGAELDVTARGIEHVYLQVNPEKLGGYAAAG